MKMILEVHYWECINLFFFSRVILACIFHHLFSFGLLVVLRTEFVLVLPGMPGPATLEASSTSYCMGTALSEVTYSAIKAWNDRQNNTGSDREGMIAVSSFCKRNLISNKIIISRLLHAQQSLT